MLLSIHIVYNLYVATDFYRRGILSNVLLYFTYILSREVSSVSSIFFRKYNVIASSELLEIICTWIYRVGYFSLLLYLVLSGLFIASKMLGIKEFQPIPLEVVIYVSVN